MFRVSLSLKIVNTLPYLLRSLSTSAVASSSGASSSSHGIKSVGVIGCGQMGTGIAYVAAKTAKVQVIVCDSNAEQIKKGSAFMDKLFERDVQKGKITAQEAKEAKSRVKIAEDGIPGLRDVDMVMEAVSENLPLKQKIFSQLSTVVSPSCILASNTSSISLSRIAASALPPSESPSASTSTSPSRVLGLHWFQPVPVMQLVELIAALQTDKDVLRRAKEFAVDCGKEVVVSQDTPGFISNRLLMPFINEAIIAFETGVGSRDDIDTTLRLGMAHKMGPLALADFIGLDTCLAIMETLHRETGDSKYRPSVLLSRMVDAGYLGKKAKKGFYEY